MNRPSIGRIVHFVDDNGEHKAAIITRVYSETCVNLTVFGDTGPRIETSVLLDEVNRPGRSFHWPERTAFDATAVEATERHH